MTTQSNGCEHEPAHGPPNSAAPSAGSGSDEVSFVRPDQRPIRAQLLERLRRIDDPDEIQRAAARFLGEHLRAARTIFFTVDEGGDVTVVAEHSPSPNDMSTPHLGSRTPGLISELQHGRAVVVDDVATDRRLRGTDDRYLRSAGIRSLVAVPIAFDGRTNSLLIVTDTTARQWLSSEVALLEETAARTQSDVERAEAVRVARFREQQLRHVLETVPSVLFTTDAEGQVEMTLGQVRAILGVEPRDVVGTVMWPDLIHPADRHRAVAVWRRSQAAGDGFEVRYRITDSGRWVMVRAVPIDDGGRRAKWFGTVTDVHALVTAEQALETANETLEERVRLGTERARELASSLSRSEHHERRRLGHVLHDDLQQILYSLQLKVNGAVAALEQSRADDAATRLLDVQRRLQSAIEITHNLTVDLSPPLLSDGDLDEALQWLVSYMADQHDLTVCVDIDDSISIDDDLRIMLFHITRELLFNVAKHAGTDAASIRVQRIGDDLELAVHDDGRGFDIETHVDGSGLGLRRVRERLQLLGGELDVRSSPARGCTVVVTVPLDPDHRGPGGVRDDAGGDTLT